MKNQPTSFSTASGPFNIKPGDICYIAEPNDLLTPVQLAARWSLSKGTLSNWRNHKTGPSFIKIGAGKAGNVLYRMADVLAYEAKNTKFTRGEAGPAPTATAPTRARPTNRSRRRHV